MSLESAVSGYQLREVPQPEELKGTEDWTPAQWRVEFKRTRDYVATALNARDPYIIVARSGVRLLTEANKPEELSPELAPLEQSHVEFLQVLLLISDRQTKSVPTSPGNFTRIWFTAARHLHSFLGKMDENPEYSRVQNFAIRMAQTQTLYYRNLFSRRDCEETLLNLLKCVGDQSVQVLGYKLSDLFLAAVRLVDLVGEKLQTYLTEVHAVAHSTSRKQVLSSIRFFCDCSPIAKKVWRDCDASISKLERLRYAGLQLSELGYPWALTISNQTIRSEFPPNICEAIYKMSVVPGDLKGLNPEHVYLDNPIWKQPYVRLPNDDLFIPIPYLIFSFPFLVMNEFVADSPLIRIAYESARSIYLEKAVTDLIKTGLPTARVYQNVSWTAPLSKKTWENDVVAVVENFVFLFEVKSGSIKNAARRGGVLSLEKNFRELFVEPGEQASRLQSYLTQLGPQAKLYLKATGQVVDLKMDRPKVVCSFSVCMEHFAALTSAKSYYKEMGLIKSDAQWSPVLSLGELQMIVRFLDSEISLVHYLTRRCTLEQILDFHGDEQDLLSVYLNTRLWIDASQLEGRKVAFFKADAAVRQAKSPRVDRRIVETYGESLTPIWSSIVRYLYDDHKQRHRFDIINTILNQSPAVLRDLEKCIRRYRRGLPRDEEGFMYSSYLVGKKQFVVAVCLESRMVDPESFQNLGRAFAMSLLQKGGAIECSTFLFSRRSKEVYAMSSFFRFLTRLPKDEEV